MLSNKVDVGRRIRQAYQEGDKESLKKSLEKNCQTRSEIENFHKLFSHQWLKETRPGLIQWIFMEASCTDRCRKPH
ncbi:MAG: hypothetical protein ACLRG1_10330 [Streptococcus salivarius]